MPGPSDTRESPHWVFGYGSLIWKPGFEFMRAEPVRVHGVHRSLCIRSIRYRGTEERPGLVFGLMRGGSCAGMGFQISGRIQGQLGRHPVDRAGDVVRHPRSVVRFLPKHFDEIHRNHSFTPIEKLHREPARRLKREPHFTRTRTMRQFAGPLVQWPDLPRRIHQK